MEKENAWYPYIWHLYIPHIEYWIAQARGSRQIRPPCTLKHRVQQEYNSLLVNTLNHIFKSNLSLNNFKWLLTKLELSCVWNIIPRSRKRLRNGHPVLGASKSRPRWAAHTRIGNVWKYPPPPPRYPHNLLEKIYRTEVSFTKEQWSAKENSAFRYHVPPCFAEP